MNTRRVVALTLALVAIIAVTSVIGVVLLSGRADSACTPAIPPVDPQATQAARCAAATLDDWRSRDVMGVGQQLDVQEPARMRAPLEELEPLRPAVVGFDFDELLNAQAFFGHDPVPYLTGLARDGLLLTATWHPGNPVTGGRFDDRSWSSIDELLDPASAPSASFWPAYDELLAQARRFQDEGVAVIFKPLHEASGDWFWWGAAAPDTYRELFAQMQTRAYASGVHNLLWGYAANPQRYDTDGDPIAYLPASIDLAGLDVYDDEGSTSLTITDYRDLQDVAPRMALTEVGPRGSTSGAWSPTVITDTLRSEGLYAAFALLWRDEPQPGNRYQISSLDGGVPWLESCPNGLCSLGAQ